MTRQIVSIAWLAMVFCLSAQALASPEPSKKAERVFQKALGELCSKTGNSGLARDHLSKALALGHPYAERVHRLHWERIEEFGIDLALPHEWCALIESTEPGRKKLRALPSPFDGHELALKAANTFAYGQPRVSRHLEIAFELYLLAAILGDEYKSQLGLAEIYAMEHYQFKNYRMALRIYELLGNQRLPIAQLRAGEAYLFGIIVPRDFKNAKTLLEQSSHSQSFMGFSVPGEPAPLGVSFPGEPTAFVRLGQLHYMQGKNTEALRYLAESKKHAPSNPEAASLLTRINAESSPPTRRTNPSANAPTRTAPRPRPSQKPRPSQTSTTDVLAGIAVLGGLWWALSSTFDDSTQSSGTGDDSIKQCTNRIVECWPQIRLGGFGAGYYDMECARVYSGQNVKSCEERDVDINDRSYYCDPVTGNKGWTSNEVASASCR